MNENSSKASWGAAAEGANRAKVNQALGSLGIQLKAESDNAQYCIKASSAIVRGITEKAGVPIDTMDDDDRFVAAIFCFVASNHLSRIVGAPFEMVATIVPLDLCGLDCADQVRSWGDSFNRISREGRVTEAIGQNIAKWISTPNDEQLEMLVALYRVCRQHT